MALAANSKWRIQMESATSGNRLMIGTEQYLKCATILWILVTSLFVAISIPIHSSLRIYDRGGSDNWYKFSARFSQG